MLVGRQHERERIEELLAEARAGRSGALALVGEPGIGKTALLADAEQRARTAGMAVLRARGIQSEAAIPFAGLFELLRPLLDRLGRIPQPQAEALESALALRPGRARDRFAVGAAALSLLAARAEEAPLAVVVDDAHWLDGSSSDALLFAARRLVADPIALVLAVREGEPSLLDGADLPALALAGLDGEECAALLGRPRGDALAARLHRETGGNPLAVLELAAPADAPDLPPGMPVPAVASVAESFARRVRGLPEATRAALLLAAASDGSAAPLGAAVHDLEPAEAAGLVSLDAGRVEFRHPLVRSAVYGDAAPEERRAAHRALADALPDAEADRRAWHLALAAVGPDDAACSALEQAGARAQARSAYVVASSAFERAALLAADAQRRALLLHSAADSAWLGGLADRAVSLLDEARRQGPDERVGVRLEQLRGHVAARRGPVLEGHAILMAAAPAAARLDRGRAATMLADAVLAGFYAADRAAMEDAAAAAEALAGPDGDAGTAFFARMLTGMSQILSGAGDAGAAAVRDAVALLEGEDALGDDPRLLTWAAMGPIWLREAGPGHGLVERALTAARDSSAVGVLPLLLNHLGVHQAGTGRWSAARAAFDEAMRLARETGQRTELATSLSRLAWLAARRGREDECRAYAAEALELSRSLGVGLCELWTLSALADLELGLGRAAEALEPLEQRAAALAARGISDVDLSPAPELVDAYLRLRRERDATAAADAYEAAAAAKGQPWALARAGRLRGLLAPAERVDEEFERALLLHRQTPDVFESARTQLAYGSRLRRERRRVEARTQLRAAIEAFDGLGAAPWAELARAELAATGETARRRDPATLGDLTPQEFQIAQLLAEGATTREAAAALFLSPKTIEYHLRNAYRKLGIHSREELAAALR